MDAYSIADFVEVVDVDPKPAVTGTEYILNYRTDGVFSLPAVSGLSPGETIILIQTNTVRVDVTPAAEDRINGSTVAVPLAIADIRTIVTYDGTDWSLTS